MTTMNVTMGDQVYTVLLDDRDFEELGSYKWRIYRVRGGAPYVRAYINENDRVQALHTMIMKPPRGKVVDHINHNPLDNRRSNLRIVTPHQNNLNSVRSKETTPYVGVHVGTRGYFVHIEHKGISYRVTWFKTAEQAKVAHRCLLEFLIGTEDAAIVDTINTQ